MDIGTNICTVIQTYGLAKQSHGYNQRWEFIKENKKVRKQENTLSTKKAIKKTRKKERKQELDQESEQEKKNKKNFFS